MTDRKPPSATGDKRQRGGNKPQQPNSSSQRPINEGVRDNNTKKQGTTNSGGPRVKE